MADKVIAGIGRNPHCHIAAPFFQYSRLVAHHHIDAVNKQHRVFLARVVTAFENGEAHQSRFRDTEFLQDRDFQGVRVVIERKADFVDS